MYVVWCSIEIEACCCQDEKWMSRICHHRGCIIKGRPGCLNRQMSWN